METCRTCAKCDFQEETNWLDLFHPNRWENEIQHIRVEFVNWKLGITQNDGLPQKICSDCFSKFCNVYTFRVACQEAQVKLNNIFDRIDIDDESQLTNDEQPRYREEAPTNNGKLFKNGEEDNNMVYAVSHNEITNDNQQNRSNKGGLIFSTESVATDNKTQGVTHDFLPENTAVLIVEGDQDVSRHEHFSIDDLIEEGFSDDEQTTSIVVPTAENKHNICSKLKNEQNQIPNEAPPFTFACKYCYNAKADNCKEVYATQQALLAHITANHNLEYPYGCPYCEKCFQDVASRTTHIKDAHILKNYECKTCGKKYADRVNLRNHIEKYHNEMDFECEKCEKRFHSRRSLNYHKKWHNPERQLKCGFCDRLFINQRHLKCHEATHTGIRKSEHCTFCGKSFIHLKTLRWHIFKQHGGEKPYKCRHCIADFSSYLDKRIHMLQHHIDNLTSMERIECMLCHQRFENDTELTAHLIVDEKPKRQNKSLVLIENNKRVLQNKRQKSYSGIFQCEICTQRFNMKSALERHSKVHEEGRPYSCNKCLKRFKRVQDMKWHMKTHSEEKPNVCDVCGKGFALKYVLNQHRRSHEVLEKKFQCDVCGKAYLFEKTLRTHKRTHTGNTYYTCDLCNEKFVTHIKLKYHLQKFHCTYTETTKGNVQDPVDFHVIV